MKRPKFIREVADPEREPLFAPPVASTSPIMKWAHDVNSASLDDAKARACVDAFAQFTKMDKFSDDRDNLRLRAMEWIAANPEAFALFEKFSAQLAARRRRFGLRLVAERVRWEVMTTWAPDLGFKINDHYTPYVARELLKRHPEWEPLIELRETRY